MRAVILTLFSVFCSIAAVCSAETITVNPDGKADFTTIQAAIIDANDGDTIIVADGTYTGADNRDIVFLGKAVTVRSENGPQSCFIDCEGLGRGFLIHNGEGPNSVIDGFTIINGSAGEGGGILCEGAGPTILNCIILENEAYYGGGVSIIDSAGATLQNCLIARNISKGGGAAGIDCVNADPVIVNCTVADNSGPGDAGGISLIGDSDALITNSILWGDSPNEIHVEPASSAAITYSDIQGAWPGEGNINADPCFAPAIYGLVSRWKFDEGGGSIAFDSAGDNDGTIYGAQWIDGFIGGALNFDAADDYVGVPDDPSLRVNQSASFSVSVWAKPYSNRMINSWILSKMRADERPGVFGYSLAWQEQTSQFRFIVENSWRDSTSLYSSEVPPGSWYHVAIVYDNKDMKIYVNGALHNSDYWSADTGSTEPDKEFVMGARSFDYIVRDHFDGSVDDVRFYGRALLADEIDQLCRIPGGYHLLPDSPCIDAGDPNYSAYSDQTDLDGNPRVVGGIIDMGVYEAQAALALSYRQFEFSANEGRQNPPDQTLTIRNTGTRTLNWRIDCDCNWLTVEPNSGSTDLEPNEISLSADTSPFTRGVYDCNLIVSDPAAQGSPQTVLVELFVHGPIIELSDTSFFFLAPPDAPDPGPQTLSIRNAGGGTLNWRIDHDCNWLTVEPNSGASFSETCEVILSVDPSGLVPGNYTCYVVVSDPEAENSPQAIAVDLDTNEGCFPTNYPDYAEWLSVGAPECWCYARQCRGDADGKRQASCFLGYMWVSTNDLRVLIDAWQVKEPPKASTQYPNGISDVPSGICADFNHQKQGNAFSGYMRVSTDDLAILIQAWQVHEPPKNDPDHPYYPYGIPGDCVPVPVEP